MGLYQFRVMPFTNAPAEFQRLMQPVLRAESANTFVSVYLDDVIIFSKTLDDHIGHLTAVFNQLD